MMDLTIELKGFAELAAALRELPENLGKNVLRSAVGAGAAVVRREAKKNAEGMRDTGTLARAIYQKQIREESGPERQTFYVGARQGKAQQKVGKKQTNRDAYYARFVELGHFSRPSNVSGRTLRNAIDEDQGRQVTTAAEDVISTLGATLANRLYPAVAPAGVVAPYAVYQMVSGVPVTHLTGQSDMTNWRLQVDLFGREKIPLDSLAEGVKSAMDGAALFKSVCQNQMDLYEDPAQYYRVMLDFSIWR
jgi:hypothetical protein